MSRSERCIFCGDFPHTKNGICDCDGMICSEKLAKCLEIIKDFNDAYRQHDEVKLSLANIEAGLLLKEFGELPE